MSKARIQDMILVPNTPQNLKKYYPDLTDFLYEAQRDERYKFLSDNQWLDIGDKEEMPSGYSQKYLDKEYPGWEERIIQPERKELN